MNANDKVTICFTYEELDTLCVALACYECSVKREAAEGRADRLERTAEVLAAIETAYTKIQERQYPKRPDAE